MKKILFIIIFSLFFNGSVFANWNVTIDENEFEEKKSIFLMSDDASPNKKLSFPYEDTISSLVVGCNGKGSYWIYFFFSGVNLKTTGFTDNGNSTASASVKHSKGTNGLELEFEIGSNFIFINPRYDEAMFQRISESDSIMVQFDHYSDGKRHYKYNTLNFTETFDKNCKRKRK